MKTQQQLINWNHKLNKDSFKLEDKIKRLANKIPWISNDLKMLWSFKGDIKRFKRDILLNQQQVRFNMMALTSGSYDK